MTEPVTINMLVEWGSKLGTPGIFAILAWRLWVFFRPHIEALIPILFELLRGHISLMNALEQALGDQSKKLDKSLEVQGEHGVTLKEIYKHVAT